MLKGVNKKVVEVMDIENEYFEKAILFIKAEKQERDDKTIKQRAGDYLHSIRYTPRTALSFSRIAVGLVKFGGAAAWGAIAAQVVIH
ncbi:MAG: hypothetical protein RRY54_03995 [Angelakisella sp.]